MTSDGPYASLHLTPDRKPLQYPPLSFYRPDALPATQPTASKHWRQSVPYTRKKSSQTSCGPKAKVETNGQTDRRMRPIALPSPLTRSQITVYAVIYIFTLSTIHRLQYNRLFAMTSAHTKTGQCQCQ